MNPIELDLILFPRWNGHGFPGDDVSQEAAHPGGDSRPSRRPLQKHERFQPEIAQVPRHGRGRSHPQHGLRSRGLRVAPVRRVSRVVDERSDDAAIYFIYFFFHYLSVSFNSARRNLASDPARASNLPLLSDDDEKSGETSARVVDRPGEGVRLLQIPNRRISFAVLSVHSAQIQGSFIGSSGFLSRPSLFSFGRTNHNS